MHRRCRISLSTRRPTEGVRKFGHDEKMIYLWAPDAGAYSHSLQIMQMVVGNRCANGKRSKWNNWQIFAFVRYLCIFLTRLYFFLSYARLLIVDEISMLKLNLFLRHAIRLGCEVRWEWFCCVGTLRIGHRDCGPLSSFAPSKSSRGISIDSCEQQLIFALKQRMQNHVL